jgi:ATP-dependent Clp protease adaptor protein ClpS
MIMNKKKLILLNDNVNSFDGVILALMEVCGYNIYQAEQCALIVHNTGKCIIKEGFIEELDKWRGELKRMGLKIKIE